MIHAEQSPREVSMLQLIPKSAVGGTGVTTLGALSHNDVLALMGFVFTVLSFLVNWYFQYQKHKQDTILNAAQIESIKKV